MSDIITTHEIKCCACRCLCLVLCASLELDFALGFQRFELVAKTLTNTTMTTETTCFKLDTELYLLFNFFVFCNLRLGSV
jgi:hypothetical protein